MRCHLAPWSVSFTLSLLAQEAPAPSAPKRSLADGLVRQRIEIDRLTPPVVMAGLEVGAGEGPMVLLVRRGAEPLVLHEIERGPGEHGPAARKTDLGEAAVESEIGAPEPPASRPGIDGDVLVVLARRGDELATGLPASPRELLGPAPDRPKLREWLQRQFETTRTTRFEGRLQLRVAPDVLLQDVLTTWEVARGVGFRTLLIEDRPPGVRASQADRELLAGLAERFGWRVEKLGGVQPVCDAELLFLVEATAPFREVGGLIRACAETGYWQIGFVGQADARVRWKLPVHLPFHGS